MEVDKGGASSNITVEGSDQVRMDSMRIFVGGLGEGVTNDDLRRMFVALGSVDEIEIVRTKGRSMAYLNFTPLSAKSLAKLFSSFNGCVWKGGRLRIEKAKEHYIVKMKREQEHEEELARNDAQMKLSAAAVDVVSLKKPSKGPVAEKEQLRIFFPKLRKVKPLPFSGSGKHKYSFRNIQVPPLPTHFCECELHSVPYDAPIGNGIVNFDALQSGVDEKEFDLMNSVLNKFISNDENSSVKAEGARPNENISPDVSNGILSSDDYGANSEPDEDGIIINISGAMKETDFSGKLEDKTVSGYQEKRGNRPQALEVGDKRLPDSFKKRKWNEENSATVNATLKRKKDDKGVCGLLQVNTPLRTQKSKWKDLVGQGSDSSFKLSSVLCRGFDQDSVQQEDTEGESSKSDEPDDETEASTDESVQQEDTEEESSEPEESGDEAEESIDEYAQHDNTEEESSKSEEHDDEASAEESTDESAQQEDSEDILIKSEDLNGLEEAYTEDAANESDQESLQQDEYELESSKPDKQDNFEEAEPSSGNPLIHWNAFEQPPSISGENKQQEEVEPTETEVESVKLKKGATWSQKMPWTQLVYDLDNSSFSISQILPGNTSENLEAAKPNPESKDSGTCQLSKALSSETAPASAVFFTDTAADLHEKKSLNNLANNDEASYPSGAIKTEDGKSTLTLADSILNQKHVVKTETYESRPFVRCASSLKEWAKTKEALRKSRTKKRKVADE